MLEAFPQSRDLQVALRWQWLPLCLCTVSGCCADCDMGISVSRWNLTLGTGRLSPGCPSEGDRRGSVLSHNHGNQQAGFLCGLFITEGTDLANTKFSVAIVQPSSDDKPDKFLCPWALNWPRVGTGLGPSFQGHLRFPAHSLK